MLQKYMPIALLLLLNYKVLKIYSYDNSLKSGHQNVKSIVCKVQLQTIGFFIVYLYNKTTACTRMAEKRIDVKVLQYIMGHAHIDVTMDVYNHVSEMSRIESEITRLESVAIS